MKENKRRKEKDDIGVWEKTKQVQEHTLGGGGSLGGGGGQQAGLLQQAGLARVLVGGGEAVVEGDF